MQIKDLIAKLQALYNTYDDEYKATMGEPEIMIDAFECLPLDFKTKPITKFKYVGFCHHIHIDKSRDGIYDILSGFHKEHEDHHKAQKAPQQPSGSLPGP